MMKPDQAKEILKKVRQIEIRTKRLVTDSLLGQYHSVFKGRGMNFEEVREYSPGDEVRAIDWNVTARTGRAFVKKFTEERELTILLLVDVSASGSFGSTTHSKRELSAELASVLAFSAIRNNDKVGLILFSDSIEQYIPPKKGRRHVLRVVREILFFNPKNRGTNISCALDFASKVVTRRAVAFLISDFQASNYRQALKLTSKRHDLVAVNVVDPREREIPSIGLLSLEDAETGEQLELDTSSADIRKRFSELNATRLDSIRKTLRSTGVDVLELNTEQPYMLALLQFFAVRERRRG
jgi:uncharacterized protein (DUF58 family)